MLISFNFALCGYLRKKMECLERLVAEERIVVNKRSKLHLELLEASKVYSEVRKVYKKPTFRDFVNLVDRLNSIGTILSITPPVKNRNLPSKIVLKIFVPFTKGVDVEKRLSDMVAVLNRSSFNALLKSALLNSKGVLCEIELFI